MGGIRVESLEDVRLIRACCTHSHTRRSTKWYRRTVPPHRTRTIVSQAFGECLGCSYAASCSTALFEQILAGELGTIFGDNTMAGLHFKKVKARVAMERTTEALAEAGLPAELAETIVTAAVHELE